MTIITKLVDSLVAISNSQLKKGASLGGSGGFVGSPLSGASQCCWRGCCEKNGERKRWAGRQVEARDAKVAGRSLLCIGPSSWQQ